MNVYQMYHENNCQYGFFVKRNSWATIIAKVIGIEGVEEGKNIEGIPPYYGNPNPKVYVELYKLNEYYYLDTIDANLLTECNEYNPNRFIEINELPCPGTYSYQFISNF